MFHPQGPSFGELARQALSSTRRGYDLLAPKFDRTPFRTPDPLLAAVAPLLGAPGSVDRAIDLCCGTGAGVRMLAPLCRHLVVGADFSLGMLAVARRQLRGLPGPAHLQLVQDDVLQPGFAGAFELATVFGALGHFVPRQQAALFAAARDVLVPGGRLAFVLAPLPPPWSLALWLAAAFDAGMWVRNRLWRPPFVMYYLGWPLGRTVRRLEAAGFAASVLPLGTPRVRLVVATRVEQGPNGGPQ
jgi:SAM-dependent methyltransferase